MTPATARLGPPWLPWRRAGAIARVLRRHHIDGAAVRVLVAADAPAGAATRAGARLRGALEELGPTFVKFGQMLAQRPDLLPDAALAELRRLEDAVPAFPSAEARALVERELGERVDRLFADFEDAPLAAASISQVHRATLRDGSRVAVKVQRPGLRATIEADLELLDSLARRGARWFPAVGPLAPVELVAEFAKSLRRELDFRLEAQAAHEIAAALADEPDLVVPTVLPALSTERVLTTSYSSGRKLGAEWPSDPEARRRIADLLLRTYLRQVLEVGVFHADLHPGNLFLDADGRVCLHDFGIAGHLDAAERERLQSLLLALVARDARWTTDVYLAMGVLPATVDRAAFERDLAEAITRFLDGPASHSSVGEVLREFIRLSRQHRVRVPHGILLVAKGFMQVEAQAAMLVPGYDARRLLGDFALAMIARQMRGGPDVLALAAHGYHGWLGVRRIGATLPGTIATLADRLARGEFALHVRHDRLDHAARRLDRAVDRLSLALVTAAFLIAAAVVMTSHVEPHWLGMPWLAWIGYAIAAALAFGWARSVWRAGRP